MTRAAANATRPSRSTPAPVAGCIRCRLHERACPGHELLVVKKERDELRRQVRRLERELTRLRSRVPEGAPSRSATKARAGEGA